MRAGKDVRPAPELSRKETRPKVFLNVRDQWRRRGLSEFLELEGFRLAPRTAEVLLTDLPKSAKEIRPALIKLQAEWPGATVLALVSELSVRNVLLCLAAGALGVLAFDDAPALLVS